MFDFAAYLDKVINIGYRSSAIAPLLWLNALIGVPCLVSSFFTESVLKVPLFLLAAGLLIYTLYMYRDLVKTNPRLVQSERFQIEMQKLDVIAEKGGTIIFDPVSIPLSEDPQQLLQEENKAFEG